MPTKSRPEALEVGSCGPMAKRDEDKQREAGEYKKHRQLHCAPLYSPHPFVKSCMVYSLRETDFISRKKSLYSTALKRIWLVQIENLCNEKRLERKIILKCSSI